MTIAGVMNNVWYWFTYWSYCTNYSANHPPSRTPYGLTKTFLYSENVLYGMNIETVSATENPVRTACIAGRNDYYSHFVMDDDYEEVMGTVDGDTLEEQENHLIQDFMNKGHYGPLEHPSISFAIEGVSRACMAQARTHRHMTFDVQSQRYVDFSGDVRDIVKLPKSLEPDSSVSRENGLNEVSKEVRRMMEESYYKEAESSIDAYNMLLEYGLPKEDARFILPIGTKVNMVVSANARSWMHFFDMRRPANAQWEVRELANGLLDKCIDWFPELFQYYKDKGNNKLSP